jgi:tetratricopeptide (TPR) repeat protein
MILEFFIILAMAFSTYIYTAFRSGSVIDDVEGIQRYDGKIKDKTYYAYLKHLWWFLWGKDMRKHHLFSVLLHTVSCGLLYLFLETLFGNSLAFWATLLFAVHPINNQSIAWVSGRGYPLGLIGLLLSLQVPKIVSFYPSLETLTITKYLMFSLIFIWGIVSQFATMISFPVLIMMHEYSLAILSAFIMLIAGAWFVKDTIDHRAKTFKEQSMENTTKFHLKKLIVAIKTFAYYTQLCVFPAHMGIYHKWGYHYEDGMEKEDNMFWLGIALLLSLGGLFYFGNDIVRFGIIWYVSYIFIFLNWITIHQFVSERYCYIANIGLCIIIGDYIQNTPILGAFIVGLYLMRTWQHLPTYCDEIRFYLSNIWNFPDSEVAMANLGVILMRAGLVGMAVDYWLMATKMNPNYDVPFYNLYSTLKGRGDFTNARKNLQSAINSKTCHFKDMWTQELLDFDKELIKNRNNMMPQQFPTELQYKFVNDKDEIIDATPPKPLPDKTEPQEILKDLTLLDAKGNRITIKIKEKIMVKIPQYPRLEMRNGVQVMVFKPEEPNVDTTRVCSEGPKGNLDPVDIRNVGTSKPLGDK